IRSGYINAFMHPSPTCTKMTRYISTIYWPDKLTCPTGWNNFRTDTDNLINRLFHNLVINRLFINTLAIFFLNDITYFLFSTSTFLGNFLFPFIKIICLFYLFFKGYFLLSHLFLFNQYIHKRLISSYMYFLIDL